MTNFVLTPDNVRGTVQYVTKTGATTFVSELLPADAAVGDRYLCQADQNIYVVATVDPIVLNLVGPQQVRVVDPWDGTVPTDDADASDGNYPDASYFFNGPIAVDENGDATDPYYVSVRNGVVEFVLAADLSPRLGGVFLDDSDGYSVISNAALLSVTKAVVGDAPADIDALFAAQAETNVEYKAGDEPDEARKTELLKFYNILDADGNLTALGVPLENRIKYNAAVVPDASVAVNKVFDHHLASPTPGGTDVTYTSIDATSVSTDPTTGEWTGESASWADAEGQFVDLETGTNQSVGFLAGRVGGALTKGAAAPGDVFPAEATVTASNATNAGKLAGLGYVAVPTTLWTEGQKVTIGTYDFHWNGTAWAAGAAPA